MEEVTWQKGSWACWNKSGKILGEVTDCSMEVEALGDHGTHRQRVIKCSMTVFVQCSKSGRGRYVKPDPFTCPCEVGSWNRAWGNELPKAGFWSTETEKSNNSVVLFCKNTTCRKTQPQCPVLLNALHRGQPSKWDPQFTSCKFDSAVLKFFFVNTGLIKSLQEHINLYWIVRSRRKDRVDGLKPFCGSFENRSLLAPGQNNEFKVIWKVGKVTKEQNRQNSFALDLFLKYGFFYSRKNAYT